MASNYQHALVSYCTTPEAKQMHEQYSHAPYRGDELKAFIKATCAALGLPEWMQGRVAALQMIPPRTYVPGIGLRVDDKIFYVVEEEAE